MIATILLLLAAAYAILLFRCAASLSAPFIPPPEQRLPPVSIIIAARNEEDALPRCLSSIAGLVYPPGLLEVIVVDDGSTDATPEVIRHHARTLPFLRGLSTGPPHGKVHALTAGIAASTGEILFFTDADCRVPSTWIRDTVRFYDRGEVGMVAGWTQLEGRGWFAQLQALDWMFLFSIAAAAVRLRYPITAVGNNLSVRRAAYESTGGYGAIPASVTEDFALVQAVAARGWEIRFPLLSGTMVSSTPCATPRALFAQKKRWFLGGVGMRGSRRMLFLLGYAGAAMLAAGAWTGNGAAVAAALLLRAAAEAALVMPALRVAGRRTLLTLLPLAHLYGVMTTLVFPPLVLLSPRVRWKGRMVANEKAHRKPEGSS